MDESKRKWNRTHVPRTPHEQRLHEEAGGDSRRFFDVIREIDEELEHANRKEETMEEPKALGIPPAQKGALQVLQFATTGPRSIQENSEAFSAAYEVATYHAPIGDQADRHARLSDALAHFLRELVGAAPPGPERSTAISRAREAKMWASAAIAMEGR